MEWVARARASLGSRLFSREKRPKTSRDHRARKPGPSSRLMRLGEHGALIHGSQPHIFIGNLCFISRGFESHVPPSFILRLSLKLIISPIVATTRFSQCAKHFF